MRRNFSCSNKNSHMFHLGCICMCWSYWRFLSIESRTIRSIVLKLKVIPMGYLKSLTSFRIHIQKVWMIFSYIRFVPKFFSHSSLVIDFRRWELNEIYGNSMMFTVYLGNQFESHMMGKKEKQFYVSIYPQHFTSIRLLKAHNNTNFCWHSEAFVLSSA